MTGWTGRTLVLSAVALFLAWCPLAHATIYSWKDNGGVRVLSNDPADVPEDRRASAQQFTAKPAPRGADDDGPRAMSASTARIEAYQRGYDAGMAAAERQLALVGEWTRTVLAAVPQTPPAPIIIEQAAPQVMPDSGYGYAPAYYGAPPYYGLAGYPPYAFPFAFGVSFVPHRHFFPGGRHRFGPFFPHGQVARAWAGRMR